MVEVASINGVALHYADEGPADAPAMVFANSLGTDLRIWDPLLPHLPAGWRHLRFDKRGHGLSGGASGGASGGDAAWSIDDLTDDLAALMDRRGVRDAVIVGLSVGGLIAIGLAAKRPDLVRALVLCDTAAKIGDAAIWNPRIEAVEAGGMAAILEPTLGRWFTERFRSDPARLSPWRLMLARADPAGYVATCRAIRDADYRERASALTVPALAVAGEADGSTPPEVVRAMAESIPGCGFEIVEGAGHIPNVEQPERLARLIGAFVATP